MSDVSAPICRREGRWLARFDHGWPWLLAGLLFMISAGVFPSEERLERERASVEILKAQRVQALQTVDAYETFLDGIDAGDETVIRRLAAAQLGLMPRGDELLERLTGLQEPPTRWIERSVVSERSTNSPPAVGRPFVNDSILASILSGEGRVWLFGGAILAIFIGLLGERGAVTGSAPAVDTSDFES
ncbi:MAG TPA: hypothetical protein DCX60_05095 [Phycisphaerales bacterium]|nr:hypothetical protein [Phycisphaerales bacterium]